MSHEDKIHCLAKRLLDGYLEELEPVIIGGYPYCQRDAWKLIDPIAYRCAISDFYARAEEMLLEEDAEDDD